MKQKNARQELRYSQKIRRGATLVFVAILMTVVMMFAGFGIDFSRMYAYKAQLKVLADAAALSGVTDLKNGVAEGTAKSRAVTFKASNLVNNQTAALDAADVVPVQYNYSTRAWVASTWANANGVQATPRYTADWTVGRIFGVTNRTLRETSVAAIGGSVIQSGCLAPFAIPYAELLPVIGRARTDTLYSLQMSDIDRLAGLLGGSPQLVTLNMASGGTKPYSPGWFGLIDFFPQSNGQPLQKLGNALVDAVDGCRNGNLGSVGDSLHVTVGARGLNGNPNNLRQKWQALCGSPSYQSCTRTIQIPVVNRWNGRRGNNAYWTINYIASFQLTRMQIGGSSMSIIGYFNTDPVGGGTAFSPLPGPVQGASLVY